MDEYEQIQRLREIWSRTIMTWGQIFIPLGAAIIAFFAIQLPQFIDRNWGFQFLLIGWFLFSICMFYWRWTVRHIDGQIVQLYPRMLELEKIQGMETQTSYYYNNLSKQARKELAEELKKLNIQVNEREKLSYRDFVRKVSRHKVQDLLLAVWDKYETGSVKSRGHRCQNIILGVIDAVLLAGIISLQLLCLVKG